MNDSHPTPELAPEGLLNQNVSSQDRSDWLKPRLLTKYKSTAYRPTPEYWDSLSRIYLTKAALIELDRRSALIPKSTLPPIIQKKEQRPNLCIKRIDSHNSPQLKQFARGGGPNLTDIRGYRIYQYTATLPSKESTRESAMKPCPNMPRKPGPATNKSARFLRPPEGTLTSTEATGTTTNFSRISAYDHNFETKLREHNILLPTCEHYPDNFSQWSRRVFSPEAALPSSSYTFEEYKRFLNAVSVARVEAQVISTIFPVIMRPPTYPSAQDQICSHWGAMNGDYNMVTPKLDIFEGIIPNRDNSQLRNELDSFIVPDEVSPFLPNFIGEFKSPVGVSLNALLQIAWNAAHCARGMHSLQSHRNEEEVYDNNAYTCSFVYSFGTLDIYVHHMAPPQSPEDVPHYHMTLLASWSLKGGIEPFREAVGGLRAAEKMALELREQFMSDAKTRLQKPRRDGQPLPKYKHRRTLNKQEASAVAEDLSPGIESLGHNNNNDSSQESEPATPKLGPANSTTLGKRPQPQADNDSHRNDDNNDEEPPGKKRQKVSPTPSASMSAPKLYLSTRAVATRQSRSNTNAANESGY